MEEHEDVKYPDDQNYPDDEKYTKKSEWFYPFVWLAGALLILEFIVKNFYLKSSI